MITGSTGSNREELYNWLLSQLKNRDGGHALSLETFKHLLTEKVIKYLISILILSSFLASNSKTGTCLWSTIKFNSRNSSTKSYQLGTYSSTANISNK